MGAKGFSILEVLISMAIIAVAALLISNYNSFYGSQDNNLRRACEAHAEAVIAQVTQESYYRSLGDFMPQPGNRTPPVTVDTPNAAGLSLPAGADQFTASAATATMAQYWAAPGGGATHEITAQAAGQSPQLHNMQLVQGSLRALGAIYNNVPANTALRCSFAAYAPLTSLAPPPVLSNLAGFGVTMKLEPYNATTNQTLCGAAPPGTAMAQFYAAPRGFQDANENVFFNASGDLRVGGVNYAESETAADDTELNPINAANDLARRTYPVNGGDANYNNGMIMTVRVNYQFEGRNESCSATQRFEYPADRTEPPRPNEAQVTANGSIIGAGGTAVLRDMCTSTVTTASATIRVGYLDAPIRPEEGTQLLCKDLSWRRVPTATRDCYQFTTAGAQGTLIGNNITPWGGGDLNHFTSGSPGAPYSDFAYPHTPDFAARVGYWQPCDQLTLCGQNPATVTATYNTAPPMDMYYTLVYNNLPAGCVMNFEVVAVDTAGNRSDSRLNTAANKAFLEGSTATGVSSNPYFFAGRNFTALMDEIYYPTCGNPSAASPHASYYRAGLGYYCQPGGYYRCGGSC